MKGWQLTRAVCLVAVLALPWSVYAGPAERCIADAARHHRVDYLLLLAIAHVESGMASSAIGRNTNGTVDRGLMQINNWWAPKLTRFGVSRADLMDPCVSAYVGAWILSQEIARHGSTWRAVGAYNSPNEERRAIYARKVQKKLAELSAKASS
ncbi:hypothetical protein SSTU70S_02832 [Stutzerimonas stutzeri]